jgi:hypothetical protein
MSVFLVVIVLILLMSFFIFFYLEDFYKNPITKPLSQSFWEAVVQTTMMFVALGLLYIIFKV